MNNKLFNDFNEHIKIEIKNNKKKMIILINKYIDNNYAELTFSNNKNKHLINENSIIIDEILYNTYLSKICKIVFKWDNEYFGDNDINFQIKINIDKIVKNINGFGKFPPNWNEFIKVLAKIENRYNQEIQNQKNKINLIDIEVLNKIIEDMKYNPDFCTLYVHDKYSICESVPGNELNNFINYLEDKNLFDKEYLTNYEIIKKKNLDELTYLELLTYLTFIIKHESIYPSSLYNDIENGLLLEVLNKLKDAIS